MVDDALAVRLQAAAMGVIVVIFTMIIASFALRLIFKSFTGKEEAA